MKLLTTDNDGTEGDFYGAELRFVLFRRGLRRGLPRPDLGPRRLPDIYLQDPGPSGSWPSPCSEKKNRAYL